jgi:predicted component of type VI protein secretion system
VSEPQSLDSVLADAHRQLIQRDQRIRDLELENIALRTHLESVLGTRAWRAAERFRRMRSALLRR